MTWRDVSVGADAVWQVARPGGLAVLAVAQTFARGVLTVALVVFALEVLHLGEDSVGWLNAAMGLGGLLGGVLAVTLVRITQLGRSFAAGIALWGVPLLLLAAVPTTTVAYLALIVIGVGNAFADGSMYTLLPRLVGVRIAGRALGALELLVFAGLAAGSLAAPLLVAGMGPRGGFLVAGGADRRARRPAPGPGRPGAARAGSRQSVLKRPSALPARSAAVAACPRGPRQGGARRGGPRGRGARRA